jgi:hypothetical protein
LITVNGRAYPLWSQFVEGKEAWIGGILKDHGDSMDRAMGLDECPENKITDIVLRENGKDSAFFEVIGEEYSCGFDVKYGGVSGNHGHVDGRIYFSGYGGHSWYIQKPEKKVDSI